MLFSQPVKIVGWKILCSFSKKGTHAHKNINNQYTSLDETTSSDHDIVGKYNGRAQRKLILISHNVGQRCVYFIPTLATYNIV